MWLIAIWIILSSPNEVVSAKMVHSHFRLVSKEVAIDLPFSTTPLNVEVLVDPFEVFLYVTYKLKHTF